MIKYKLTIIKTIENPNYEAEKKEYIELHGPRSFGEAMRYADRDFLGSRHMERERDVVPTPPRMIEDQVLIVEVNEEQFEAVQEALYKNI